MFCNAVSAFRGVVCINGIVVSAFHIVVSSFVCARTGFAPERQRFCLAFVRFLLGPAGVLSGACISADSIFK